jgi:hypothetical protein
VGYSRIVAGAPVRAQHWLDCAYLAHWVAGRGQVIVPGHSVRYDLTGTVTMRYRVPLSGRAIARVACLGIRSKTGTARSVTVTMGSGTTTATVGLLTLGSQVPIYVQDDGVTRTDAVSDITITVTGTDVFIESCTVWEVPRVSLSRDATDNGVAMDSLFPRRGIVDSGAQSVRGVAALMQAIDGRRIGHFARWGEVLATTSATFVSLTHAPYRVVPRVNNGALRSIRVYLYGLVSVGGTTGEWRATAASGDSATAVISSTTAAWSSVDIDVTAEDPDKPDGIDAGGYDTVQLAWRRTAGAGTVGVESWTGVEFA